MAKNMTANNGWRPAAMWVYIIASAVWLILPAYLVFMEIETMGSVTPIVMTIFAGLAALANFYSHNRTKEKMAGKEDDQSITE